MKNRTAVLLSISATLLGGAISLPSMATTLNHPEIYTAKHDTSRPLRDMQPAASVQGRTPEVDDDQNTAPVAAHGAASKPGSRQSTETSSSHPAAAGSSSPAGNSTPKQQTTTAISSTTTVGLNFDGIGDISGWPVPDSNGAVGATQYVQWVNSQFAVFNKSTGAMVLGPDAGNTLWSGFGGPCETRNDGDPIAQYDKAAGRWVMTKHAAPTDGPFYQCVAVSTTSDATGSYFRYAFPLPDYDPDYPKLGVWPDAYYLTWNLLDQNNSYAFVNPLVCAFERNSMLSGATATSVCFEVSSSYSYLLPADWDGANPPPSGAPNFFMSLGTNSINIWQFHVDFATPSNSTFTGPTTLPVNSFVQACPGGENLGLCVPQEGTSQDVDSLHDRLMYRLAYRNFPTGPESILATSSEGNPVGINWYEIHNPSGSPFTWQQGTFAPDSSYRWTPSIAMDQSGDIALGYSVSSSTLHPSIRYTGRLASDPLGTMETEATLLQGTASQSGLSRWGDYSSMSIDPTDDCTFWYTNQYILSNNNWQTRIANFKFSNCTSTPPATLSSTSPFGSQQVGTTSSGQVVTLANNQSVTLNISNIATTGDFAQTNNCGSSIPETSSCQITVTFTPTTAGTRNGTLTVTDDASNSPQSTNLTGTGTGPIVSLSPTSIKFYYQPAGTTSSPQAVTLSNPGNASLSVTSLATSGAFAETDNCAGTQVKAAGTCTIDVTFSPATGGTVSGALTINDSAGGSPQFVSLSGPGINPVSLTPVTMAFGTINVGQTSASQTATVTNNQSTALSLTFSPSGDFSANGTGSAPCGSSLAAKSSCTIAVSFKPTINGSINGSLTISHNALFSPQVVDLQGTGASGSTPSLSFSPTSLFFAKVVVGTSSSRTLTMTNSSGATVSILGVSASGAYSLTPSNPCVRTLAAGANCSFSVTFNPSILGTIDGAVAISVNTAVSPQVVSLTGTTILPITLSTPNAFGTQTVGTTSSPQTITLTNNETSTLNISGIGVSGDYALTTVGTNPCGTSVAPLAQCTIGVQFAPTVTGTIPGFLTVSYAGYSSPQVITLTGSAN